MRKRERYHHQSRHLWILATLATAGRAVGCEDQVDFPADARTVTDSAGVEIVRIRPPGWDEAPALVPDTEAPLVEIGTAMGNPDQELDGVSGVVVLPDETLVVANGGTRELRFFQRDGTFLRRAGRDGEGPGEFRDLDHLGRRGADTLVVHDRSLGRVSYLAMDGAFLTSTRLDGFIPWVVGTTTSGTIVGWLEGGQDQDTPGPYMGEMMVSAWNPRDGNSRVVTSVFGGEELRVEGAVAGRLSRGFRPFGREADFAAAGPFIYVLDGRVADRIGVYAEDGRLVRVIHLDVGPRTATTEEVEAWIDAWMTKYQDVSEQVKNPWRRGFATVGPPDPVPVLRALEVDRAGNVCAERYPPTVLAPPRFWCFTPSGESVRAFQLPAGLARRGHPHFDPDLWIEEDRVFGVWVDDLGVETVRGYRLPTRP